MATVVIQLGHCYRSTGATGTNGVDGDPNEQEFTHLAGHAAAVRLGDAGHDARIILADDPTYTYGGDAFAAIHCDGSENLSARGASAGYRTAEGQALAAAWKRAYAAEGWSGFRPDNYTAALAGYYGTRNAVNRGNRYAFIAECGFLTSPVDEALLSPPQGPDRFARALTAAVVELFGGQLPAPPAPVLEDDDMPFLLQHPNGTGFLITNSDAVLLDTFEGYEKFGSPIRPTAAKADQIIESARATGLRLEALTADMAAIRAKLGA